MARLGGEPRRVLRGPRSHVHPQQPDDDGQSESLANLGCNGFSDVPAVSWPFAAGSKLRSAGLCPVLAGEKRDWAAGSLFLAG